MENIASIAWNGVLILCAAFAAYGLVIAAKHRKKWLPPLEELVTLDSKGWFVIACVSTGGAAIMILTSQLFSSSYWLGLAIDSDGKEAGAGPLGWLALVTVTTISALALSVIFELVADIGAPAASGLKKEKKKGTPELLLIVTAFAVFMSLASKWGFYEDKRQARAVEAAQIAVDDGQAAKDLAAAEATIKRLAGTPSAEIAKKTEDAIARELDDLKAQREKAEAARDALPENQGRNRLEYQNTINRQSVRIAELEREKIAADKIRDDLKTLAAAEKARTAALETVKADAGRLTEDNREKVRIGDTVLIRLIRAGLHQALCFLFPIIALDAWTTTRKKRTAEEAARKGAETRRNNNPNAVRDADFEPAPEAGPAVAPFGGYLGREGEAPAPGAGAVDADFEGGGEAPGDDDTTEGVDHGDRDDDQDDTGRA